MVSWDQSRPHAKSTALSSSIILPAGHLSPNFRTKDPFSNLSCGLVGPRRYTQWPILTYWKNLPFFQESIHHPVPTESIPVRDRAVLSK